MITATLLLSLNTTLISDKKFCTSIKQIYNTAYNYSVLELPLDDVLFSVKQAYEGSEDGLNIIELMIKQGYNDQKTKKENKQEEVYDECNKALNNYFKKLSI